MLATKRPKAGKVRCVIIHPHTTRAQQVEREVISKFVKQYQDIVTQQSINDGQGQQPQSTGTIFLPDGRQDIPFSPN